MSPQYRMDKQAAALRMLGLCVECGSPVEDPAKYVRCAKCRKILADSDSAAKTQEALKKKREFQKLANEQRARLVQCERCDFATYAGASTWFCTLAVCKHDEEKPADEFENPLGTTITEVFRC